MTSYRDIFFLPGNALLHNITTDYEDYTYRPAGAGRPSARAISEAIFKDNRTGNSSQGNPQGKSALFAFFSQLVLYEVSNTDHKSCPVELMYVPIPTCDHVYDKGCSGGKHMPYERIGYDKDTGQSPNSPRQQTNKATSFIDASFVYGSMSVRGAYLRKLGTGQLAASDTWGKYPELNDIRLPYVTFPTTSNVITNPETLWKFGDEHAHENPGLTTLSVLFFRYHNIVAERFQRENKTMTGVMAFFKTRQWVTAVLQNIVMYEWLPLFLDTEIKPYEGYNANIEPGVSTVFDAAAMRYLMTLIPSGISRISARCPNHHQDPIRLCRSYFSSQEILCANEHGFEDILRGLVNQFAEQDDITVVEDLQSYFYGPLHFSRHDYVAQTIMRGRDYGLPDYNTVREQMGLNKIKSWEEINPTLAKNKPEVFANLQSLYHDVDDIDVFVGGMMETTDSGPGELFTAIILDQFYRLRNGDRFWFENLENRMLSEEEIKEIRSIRLSDVIKQTGSLEADEVQTDVFRIPENTTVTSCLSIYLRPDEMPECPNHHGYDYFAGICILSACIAAKCRKWQHAKEVRKRQTKTIINFNSERIRGTMIQHSAYEWVESGEEERPVVVKIKPRCEIEVTSSTGRRLRTVSLSNQKTVDVITASNKGRTTVLLKVPKEYDLVLMFDTCNNRQTFEIDLTHALEACDTQCNIQEAKVKTILESAFTQRKRNARLEKFFKSVFSEAFQMDYDPGLDEGQVEVGYGKEILDTELTKEEFAQALAVKPNSDFVENLFAMLDSDSNGYISFSDFLNTVVLFSKGSCQEKLQVMFNMFDVEKKGILEKSDLTKMFSCLLDMASSKLSKEEVGSLVQSICEQHELSDQDHINFEDFCQILSPQMDKIWNAGLDWKGRRKCYPSEKKKGHENGRRRSSQYTENGRRSSLIVENGRRKSSPSGSLRSDDEGIRAFNSLERRTEFVAIREKYSPVKARVKTVAHFVENNRQHIFYVVIFFGITAGLFAERFYYYTVEREHSGLRALMSYGISVTRGAAAAMSFTFSLLLLTMCRNLITTLRCTFLNLYIPFDSHVAFHKLVAWTALVATGLHVIGYGFNFYHLTTQPTSHLCIFDSIVLRTEDIPNFNFWFFGNMTGFTGVLLVLCVVVIYVYATQTARRLIFNGFWMTHKLIVVMYILTILHGASTIVQKPMFFVYFIGPAILFTVDKMISLSRKKTQLAVIKAEKLPSDITFIEFKRPSKFDYKSGQWVRVACLSQGRNEYHPFTLTSAPHEETLSLHIRAVGPWTWNVRQEFDPENHRDTAYPAVYLDGPYGAGQQDWYQYEVSVLVGAGIGVTPYASILKDFVHMASIRNMYKMKCKKLYFVWITGSQRHFEWLLDIIREVEEVDEMGLVSVDIFITQFFQNFDLRTAMLYICEEHFQKLSGGRSVFTGLKAATHFGRPQLSEMFQALHRSHPTVKKIGVFSCGPPGVTKSVEKGCIDASNATRALFEHHFENF
ncbi:hypothetical protein FSP39_011167 [Pinctada imbricata]|uniref:NAD(P)H oxidase (H2O2-forming) n=1 Tax=Pinctada imbricata TaxID=66713 RepID=A0AA88YQ97_PINIB|nr:hypothetical protein FSP39_011167 [Pinctada imbricata]